MKTFFLGCLRLLQARLLKENPCSLRIWGSLKQISAQVDRDRKSLSMGSIGYSFFIFEIPSSSILGPSAVPAPRAQEPEELISGIHGNGCIFVDCKGI